MAFSRVRRIEAWLRAADIGMLLTWFVVSWYFPVELAKNVAWVMGIAWYLGIVTVGGQNAAYLHPRYRIFYSMTLSLVFATLVSVVWAGSGHDWYLKGGLHFLLALGLAGTIIRLIVAEVLQRPAVQLVPCRLPAAFLPLLAELAGHPHVYVEPMLDDPSAPLPERRAGYPIFMVVSDLRVRESDMHALLPLFPKVEIIDICEIYESMLGKAAIIKADGEWTLPVALRVPSPIREVVARVFDTLFVLITAPLSLLVIGIAALAIKLTSAGPVFFRQERMGRYGVPFRMIKLRTMVTDAEAHGARWAGHGDDRVTPVGRLLRKTGLDELPQFWNILRGDMSLIGPRPESQPIVEQLEQTIPFYRARMLVLPGLAGWAQLHQGGDTTLDDVNNKLRYDLYYLKNGTIMMNLRILLGTVQMLLHLAKPTPRKPVERLGVRG